MSYGLAFGFPRNNTLAAAASPFAQLGPTLDLVFTGVGSSGDPTANDSLDLNFVGDTYSVAAPYMVWGGTGMTAENFQDIVTFTRATGNATYYNSSGYLTTAGVWNYLTYSNVFDNAVWDKSNSFIQTNLLTYSEDFTNAAWSLAGLQAFGSGSVANATIAPNGTNTADKIVEDGISQPHYIAQSATTSATIYAYSVYLKAAERSFVLLWSATANFGRVFDLSTGAVSGTVAGVTQATATIDAAGNGWYRCTIYGTCTAASNSFRAYVMTDATTFNYLGNGTSGLYIWGAQLVQGSVPGDYRATTTTALPILYPDYTGALRARKLCENTANNQHILRQTITIPANSTFSTSFYLKAGERTEARFINYDGGANYALAYINLATGTFTSTGIVGVVNSPTFAVTPVGGGWYRVTVSANLSGTSRQIYINTVNVTDSYTGDGSSGIYIADAQLNEGSSALSYFDTTQYPYNAPRFDYDPVTLLPRGLLIEEQRTNLLFQSNDFLTSWAPTNITRTLNSILSPDGNINGVKIEATAAAATLLYQAATVAATAATGSVYVKQGTGATVGNTFTLRNNNTLTNLVQGTLNYSTGVFTYSIGSSGVVVTNVGNGWWRISMTATTGITSGDLLLWYVGWSGGVQVAGDFFYAYGAQLEAGGAASSYIPTTTSQLTRAADLAIVYTLSPWFNAQAGTVYAQFDSFYPVTTVFAEAALIGIYPGGNDGFVSMGIDNITTPTTFGGTYLGSATFQASFAVTNGTWYTPNKIANSYKLNDFAFSSNGAAAVVDTSGTLPTLSATHALVIGSFGSGRFINGHIQRITYYPRRLSNTELQTLTTL